MKYDEISRLEWNHIAFLFFLVGISGTTCVKCVGSEEGRGWLGFRVSGFFVSSSFESLIVDEDEDEELCRSSGISVVGAQFRTAARNSRKKTGKNNQFDSPGEKGKCVASSYWESVPSLSAW